MIVDLILLVVLIAAVLVISLAIGILAARRIDRLIARSEEPDDQPHPQP